jgi:hypothetical protein
MLIHLISMHVHFYLEVGAATKEPARASCLGVPDGGNGDSRKDVSALARYMVMTLNSAL